MRVRSSVVVDQPVDVVFAYVADYRNDPMWRPEVTEMRYLTDEPIGVGIHALETSVLWGRRVVTESFVSRYEPNRGFDWDYVSGPYRVRGSRTFESVEGRTRVTSELEWNPSSRVARLVAPTMGRGYRRMLDRNLERLRAILEERPPR